MDSTDEYPRRLVLGSIGTGLALLAGCSGSESDPTPTPTAGARTAQDSSPTVTEQSTDTDSDARFVVESLTVSPEVVRQAHEVSISVTVRNTGNRAGQRQFPINIGDRTSSGFSLRLEPGETASKTLTVRPGVPGEFGVTVGSASASITIEQYPASFVRRAGARMTLDGERYRFHGSNNDMLYRAPEWYIDTVLSAARTAGLRVMRINSIGVGSTAPLCYLGECRDQRYSFMPSPGTLGERAFRGMDYAIFKAKQHGIRLVVPFVDNWPSSGMAQFVEWADSADVHDDFYTNEDCRAMFKSFVRAFLTRTNSFTGQEYRNDPTILMWELANEPQAHGWNEAKQEGGEPAPGKLQSWIEEMAPFVKSIDSNHLLATGGQGFYLDKLYKQDKGESFLQNNAVPAIDACSMHLYPKHWAGDDRHQPDSWNDIDVRSLRTHIQDARETVGKPFYLGEFRPATNVDRREDNWKEVDKRRAEIFKRWYDLLADRDATGAIHWFWYGPMDYETEIVTGKENMDSYNDPHTTYPWDTHTMSVLESYSKDVGSL